MCGTQSTFDSMLAVYHNEADPTNCLTCPGDNNDLWPDGLARNESCNGVIDGGAGILSGTTSPGGCYLIRLGGWLGGIVTGNSLLEITFIPDEPIVDCNDNGVPDLDDIAGVTSDDCDGNKIPDECDPDVDCNGNEVQDICDIAGGTSNDCDDDDVPDECQIDTNQVVDCTKPPNGVDCSEGPFFCITGCDDDCNDNGIIDTCDIVECAGAFPECDDCNLTGVPDTCEVASSTGCATGICVTGCSADDNEDCVPDECFDWEGDVSNNFSNGDNWEGGATPDSNDRITIGDVVTARDAAAVPATVLFDVTATVATLRIVDFATFNMTSEGETDLTIAEVGGILNEGTINVSLDHTIDVSAGAFTVGAFGSYKRDFAEVDPVSASLDAGSVSILAGNCSDFSNGGSIALDDEMRLRVAGDLVMVGSSPTDAVCASSRSGGASETPQVARITSCSSSIAAANVGITPPPDLSWCPRSIGLRTADESSDSVTIDFEPVVEISGDIVLTDAVRTVNELTTIGVQLAGDFDNRSMLPSLFGWELGKLLMNGLAPQSFEVAGIDVGFDDDAFLSNRNTLFDTGEHANYSIGSLEIAAGSDVTFVNVFGNTVGAGDCTEALYVHEIKLGDNSTIRLDNARVYFESLTAGQNVSIIRTGCGDLVDLVAGRCSPASPAQPALLFTTAWVDQKNRFISITAGDAGRDQKIRVTYTSLPPPYDVWNGETLWVQEPFQVCENSGHGPKVTPPDCGPSPGQPQKWFWAARLNCDEELAVARDWTTLTNYCTGSGESCAVDGDCVAGTCGVDGAVHLTHSAIVPSKLAPGGGALQVPANYTIEVLDESCSSTLDSSFSEPLFVTQAGWGDVVLNIATCPAGPPNLIIDMLGDVVGAINKFSNLNCAPKKTRVDLEPGTIDFKVNITDVLQGLSAFSGATYPFASKAVCPPPG